jgi:hypothetical protein
MISHPEIARGLATEHIADLLAEAGHARQAPQHLPSTPAAPASARRPPLAAAAAAEATTRLWLPTVATTAIRALSRVLASAPSPSRRSW